MLFGSPPCPVDSSIRIIWVCIVSETILTGECWSTGRRICPDATLFTSSLAWTVLALNPCLWGEEPVSDRLMLSRPWSWPLKWPVLFCLCVCSCIGILNVYLAVCSARSLLVILKRLPDTACWCAAPCSLHHVLSTCNICSAQCSSVRPAAGLFVCQKFVPHCTRNQFEQSPWSIAVLWKKKSLIQEYLASNRRRRFISILTRAAIGPYSEPLMISVKTFCLFV